MEPGPAGDRPLLRGALSSPLPQAGDVLQPHSQTLVTEDGAVSGWETPALAEVRGLSSVGWCRHTCTHSGRVDEDVADLAAGAVGGVETRQPAERAGR